MNNPDNETIINQYLNHYSYSNQSYKMRKSSLNYFFNKDYFGYSKHIFDIKTNTLIDYFEYLNKLKNINLTTKKGKWAIVKSLIDYCMEYYRDFNFIVAIPKRTIKWQKIHKIAKSNKTVIASIEEIRNILNYLREENFSSYCLFRLLIETGMRLGELLSIQVKDLNIVKRMVNCRGKTGEKVYYFSENLTKDLRVYLNGRKKAQTNLNALFLNSKNKKYNTRLIQKTLERIRVKFNTDWITPHTFRRTLNTLRKNMGCSLEDRKILLGQKTGDVNIECYTILEYDNYIQSFDKYNPYLAI